MTVLDVGQGDSILLRTPGESILVDGGGGMNQWNMGREILRVLTREGITSLDHVVITHPDLDHIMGLKGLMEVMEVRQVWIHSSYKTELVNRSHLREILTSRSLTSVKYLSNEVILSPWIRLIPVAAGRKTNNRGIVVRWSQGNCRGMLMGDLEARGERNLIKEMRSTHVLKVGHHGSRTSSIPEFLERALPQWAVISVGWRNRYRHPAPQVIERLQRFGATVLRTDVHGYVSFHASDDSVLTCQSSAGNCGQITCQRF